MRNYVTASPISSFFFEFLQSWAVAQNFYLASSPVSFSHIRSFHCLLFLSPLNYCKCLKPLTTAARTVEEGGRRLSIEVCAVSSSLQSQLWPQGGVTKMDCKRCMRMPVCALHPDARNFSSTLCTVHLHCICGLRVSDTVALQFTLFNMCLLFSQ